MDYLDTRWTKLKDYEFADDDSGSETRKFIDSDGESGDEEWVQQLQRDYGKSSGKSFSKRWLKWTSLEKYLLAGLSLALSFIVLLTIVIIVKHFRQNNEEILSQMTFSNGETLKEMRDTCVTEGCIEASYHVTQYLDKEVEPCDDFYEFSCGKWLRNAQIPSGISRWTSFSQLAESNQLSLKHTLDRLHPLKNDSEAVQKVHMFYKACRDSDWMEKNGMGSIKNLIGQVGNWGIWNSSVWNDEDWSFEQALNRIHKLKNMPLFYMFVAADDVRSNENSIQIEQSGITLPDEEYYRRSEDDKVVKAYKKLMVDVGLLLGGENVKSQMEEVFQFEKKLASIYESKESLTKADKIHNKMTVEQLQDLCPAIPWLDFMNSMFNTKVTFDEPVIVYTPHYLKNMSDLVIRTERRILSNYMVWHLIKPLIPMLSKPFRDAYSGLLKAEKGLDIVDKSWRSCVKQTDSVLGFATGYLFIKENNNKNNNKALNVRAQIEEMVTAVKEAFLVEILNKNWMDEETKAKAIEKVSLLIDMIGYPEWILDSSALENYYKNFTVTANPFKNYLNARAFYHQKTMNRRNTKPERNEWHVTPTAVNAFYNSPRNYIAFPSGILQAPFFNIDYPIAMNYGALGTILAHELTHGFDDRGRLFDGEGNMKNWWSESSKVEFERLSKCFEEQYSNFTFSGKKVSGKQTLSENIADNGGLKLAYKAYKSLALDNGKQQNLPAVSLTPDQLFFVSFAQVWCAASTASSLEEALLIDRHSPDRIRVLAAISNSEEFSKAFQCKKGAKLNPENRCQIW